MENEEKKNKVKLKIYNGEQEINQKEHIINQNTTNNIHNLNFFNEEDLYNKLKK